MNSIVTFPFIMDEFADEGALYALTGAEMFKWKKLLLKYHTAKKWADYKSCELTNGVLDGASRLLAEFEAKHNLQSCTTRPTYKEVSLLNFIEPIEFPAPHNTCAYGE